MNRLSLNKLNNSGPTKKAQFRHAAVIPAKAGIQEIPHMIASDTALHCGRNDVFHCPARYKEGFTLLEVIITLVVAAILGTILVQFMGTSLKRSTEPVVMVQEGFSLSEVMEKMTAHYKYLLATDSNPLAHFKEDIENGNMAQNTPYFGDYSIKTAYINFSGGNETPDTAGENKILKVIIDKGDQSLAALFTK